MTLQSLSVGCVDIPATGQQDDIESLQPCCILMHICVDETLVASLDDVPLDDVSLDASLVVFCYNVLYNLVQSCRKLCSLAVQLIAG